LVACRRFLNYSLFVIQKINSPVFVLKAHQTRATPFLVYFIDERWGPKIVRFKADYHSGAISLCWFFQDVFMPIATKLLAALGVPYVLAKGVFPLFGYSAAVNLAVYRLAWLGILGLGAMCYLAEVFCVELHGSIRDDRYLIGKRVEDVADKRDGSCDIKS
jgi:E3 ubiquitin-protein ligase MARCH6